MYLIIILFCSRHQVIIGLAVTHTLHAFVIGLCLLRMMPLRKIIIYVCTCSCKVRQVFSWFFSILLSDHLSILGKNSALEFVAVPTWFNSTVLNLLILYYRGLVFIVRYTTFQLWNDTDIQVLEYCLLSVCCPHHSASVQ